MRSHTRRLGVVLRSAALLLGTACQPDLNVTNPNNPDFKRALATPEDVKNLAISTMNSWYLASTYFEPYMMMGVTADVLTANFGNFGMRFNNLEPRIAYNNNSAAGDAAVTLRPWEDNYATLGAANDVLRAMDAGIVLEGGATETEKYRHLAMFTQAASLTNLGLIFDRAFIVDESFDPGDPAAPKPELQGFDEVAAAALAKWDALIAATAGKSHTYSITAEFPMVGGALSSTRMNRIANTMAALLLAYTPRTPAATAQVDWAKVAAYADKGIGDGSAGTAFDVVVQGDFNTWFSLINYYGNERTWVRVDHRVINRMNPSFPAKFNGTIAPKGTSTDARYESDFTYHGAVIGDPARGIYMQSAWHHSRYSHHARTTPVTAGRTAVPYLLAAESDLVRAEALIRRSVPDLVTAATLINKTRVGRGNLPPATAADGAATLLLYIDYERDVELMNTSGFELFRRRHVNTGGFAPGEGLQPGTVRHLPIPARELETLAMPVYTFGGVGNPDMYIGAPTGQILPLRFPERRSLSRGPFRK